jgi:hypothetical protein
MDSSQDWCLQCGAGAPGSLKGGGPSWRSAATVLLATAVLVLGAAAAAYAALSKESAHRARAKVVVIAQSPTAVTPVPTAPATPTPITPGAVTPTPKTPGATPIPKTPGATPTPKASEAPETNPLFSPGSTKTPKIPLTAPGRKSSGTTTTPSSNTNEPSGTTTPSSTNESSSGTAAEPVPAAIQLDPNAASTYNPYGYPASEFGDPSLAIDGDTSTGWTAQVNPAVAPRMAEGLVVDLKGTRRLSAAELVTSTIGMSVQVYGANVRALPTSITAPAWVQLTAYLVVKKHHVHLKLRDSAKAFRFITLWISKAPAASIGTPQAPGHVGVNELELFPAA